MYSHDDKLSGIDKNISLADKLKYLHSELNEHFSFIDRVACAIYDAKTDLLKTFIDSSGEDKPLSRYQAKLSDSGSLQQVLEYGKPRVVNDLDIFSQGEHEHTQKISYQGYRSSYTMPMYSSGVFFGFLFFNSYEQQPFTEEVLRQIDPYAHLISLTVIHELSSIQTLLATVKTARDITHLRDHETGSHLDRMSRYARIIAQKVADKYELSDQYIENIFIFSPLHDIGKIGIPDNILLKPGSLDEEELQIMRTHPLRGRELIDHMLGNFDLVNIHNIDVLRNIAEFHHEAIDGSGYPYGRSASEIPIEAKIVAVADIFDALTSCRPYKQAWSNDEAFAMLEKLSGMKLDSDCVTALVESVTDVETIQAQFRENTVG